MRIISFDPGGTTGVALYDDTFKEPWRRFSLGPEKHHAELWYLLAPEKHIVYETFLYQRRDIEEGVALELISRDYIGIIVLHSEVEENVEIYDQSPSLRMFWTDDKLRELGLWVSSPHERDATRHLLYHVSFKLRDRRFLEQLH